MISVIVPVYNVSKYLPDCIQSILAEKEVEKEIILVDDGSTDDSGRLCDAYQKKYTEIEVIHQANAGLSAARNAGIEIAKGEYITFVDSDDMISAEFLSTALTLAQTYQADFIAFANVRCEAETHWPVEGTNVSRHKVNAYNNANQKMQKFLIGKEIGTMAWAKIYKRNLFDTIRYPVGKYHEDVFTTYQVVDKAKRIVTTDQIGYIYRKSPNSITTSKFSEKRLESIEGKKEQLLFIQKNYPGLHKEAEAGVIYACNQNLLLMAEGNYKNNSVFQQLQKLYRNYGKSYLEAPVSIKGKLVTCVAMIHVLLAYRLLKIVK